MVRKKLDGTICILRDGKPLKFKKLLPKRRQTGLCPIPPDVTFLLNVDIITAAS
jgi:hypothetical protein